MRAPFSAGRWGLEGQEFAPFVSPYPASPVAALASYWAAHTIGQLDFERANPRACQRIRTEDLDGDTVRVRAGIGEFFALVDENMPPPFTLDDEPDLRVVTGDSASVAGIPVDPIPGPLLTQVNYLHARLGYPPVTAAEV